MREAGSPFLDAARLVGLLADEDRRRVVAALILGATDAAGVVRATGLDAARAGKALARLEDAGLVERGRDHSLFLLSEAFVMAARAGRATGTVQGGSAPPDERELVLGRFVRDGRLVSIPAAHGKRRVVLERLAEEFEPGRHYSESMVNLVLGRWHTDTAALRRYLVDEGFLDRAAGEYWRSGGPVAV